jgi:hypothetical protein
MQVSSEQSVKWNYTSQSSWHGFAGLVVSDAQGPMEIDCLIITHDRLLLVELKEWNGNRIWRRDVDPEWSKP